MGTPFSEGSNSALPKVVFRVRKVNLLTTYMLFKRTTKHEEPGRRSARVSQVKHKLLGMGDDECEAVLAAGVAVAACDRLHARI